MITIFGIELSYRIIAFFAGLSVSLIVVTIQLINKPKDEVLMDKLQGNMEEAQKYFYDQHSYKTRYGKFYSKHLKPFFDEDGVFSQLVAALKIDPYDVDRKLTLIKSDFTAEEFISIKILSLLIGICMMFLGFLSYTYVIMFIGLAVFYMGVAGFERVMILSKLEKRKREFIHSLPNFLDLLYSACKAGHTITEALKKVSTKYNGVVAEDFNLTMVETQGNGGNFRKAMEDMSERNNIEPLTDVISDILIAFEKGDDQIINTLKDEAFQMRDIVNSQNEEIANRKSATMIFPILLFSFIPLFALILVPMFSQFNIMLG